MSRVQIPRAQHTNGQYLEGVRITDVKVTGTATDHPVYDAYEGGNLLDPVTDFPIVSGPEGVFEAWAEPETVDIAFEAEDDVIDNPQQVELLTGRDLLLAGQDETITGDWRFNADLLQAGYNPSVEIDPTNPKRWVALDFALALDRGSGNRLHVRSLNVVHPGDPPEIVLRRGDDNNVYGPNEDGTGFVGTKAGSSLGHLAWQGLIPQGSFQGDAARLGSSIKEPARQDNPTVVLASSVTMPQGTITITGDLDATDAYTGAPDTTSFRDSGQISVGGESIYYGRRDATHFYGCISVGDTISTTLANNMTASTEHIPVDSLDGFATDGGTVLIDSEQIEYLSVDEFSGENPRLTELTRGANGTTAASHTSGTTVSAVTGGTHAVGTEVSQSQAKNGGEIHLITSSEGTNTRAKSLQINDDGAFLIGESATDLGYSPDAKFTSRGGSWHIRTLSAPSNLTATVVGTSGSTSITYKVYAVDGYGKRTTAASVTINTAPATLNTTNYVRLAWTGPRGAAEWIIERSATAGSPSSTGSLKTNHRTFTGSNIGNKQYFADTGIAASAFTAPTRNETADVEIDGQLTATQGIVGITGMSIVHKSADEVVNNSSTLQDDDELFFPVEANEVWFVEAFLMLNSASGGATSDFKFGWSGPSGATASWGIMGDPTAVTGASHFAVGTAATPSGRRAISDTISIGSVSAGSHAACLIGRFTAAATAGNIRFRWAQDTANANNSTVQEDSMLRLTRIA